MTAALLLGAIPAGAQTLVSPLVPRGHLRLDFAPSFSTWHQRYGVMGDADVVEELGSDLTDPTGRTLFPGIATLEESVRALTGSTGYTASLGASSAHVTHDVTRVDFGLRVGVFDWLTVGATAPYVKSRTALDLAFRPDTTDGGLGFNPFAAGDDRVGALLDRLSSAADAAGAYADGVCAADPGEACEQARALSTRAADFHGLTRAAYGASLFFPVTTSAIASGMRAALAALSADLAAAGLGGVGGTLVFAEEGLDGEGFVDLPGRSGAGYLASPLGSLDGLWVLGDVELTADVRLLHHDPAESGSTEGVAFTVTGGTTVRLGTGTVDDPAIFLDVGSGDGQVDLEGRVRASLRFGRWAALQAGASYGSQRARTLLRRVAPHEQVLVPADRTRGVRWTPGSYVLFELSPRLRLSEDLSLAVDYRGFDKGEDAYELLGSEGDDGPALDVSLLSRETEVTLREVSVGLRYSTVLSRILGRTPTPVEVAARWSSTVAGSGGRTPKASRVELALSLYRRVWGG